MSVVVCPLCHNGFRDSEPNCPACGNAFNYKDWPVAEVYSASGLIPQLTVKWADKSWSPTTTDFVVGRSPGYNGLTIDDPTISSMHIRVHIQDNIWKVSKVKPDHEVKINGVVLPGSECEIFSGDKIGIGISIPLEINIEYVQKKAVNSISGILESKRFDELNPEEPLRIGSDSNNCKIIIKNIDKCNTIVYYQPTLHSWWILDCASACGTKLNGMPIRNAELFDEDKISIAGIDFIFESNMLVPLSDCNTGLEIGLENLSAATQEGKLLLHNIDLQIKRGEFVGVLGPSGCGKSSLIQRLAGLGSFSQGEVRVNGCSYKKQEDTIKSLTAYVPQDVALHPDLTLDEEIKTFCCLHIKHSEITEEKIAKVLRKLQLTNERYKRIGDLSGGQKRRVTILLELLRNPQSFLLDEPTAGLDPATETDIMLYLRRITNQGKTVICSTHILSNLHLFDKILVLSCGEMVFFGTPVELLNYFQADSMLELYRLLGRGTRAEQQAVAKQYASKYAVSPLRKKYACVEKKTTKLPPVRQTPSMGQQILGYLSRQFLEFTSFRHLKLKDFFREFLTSAALIQLVIQPILIAFVLKFACASYFYVGNDYKKIFFFSAIAVFWLGLNSAIRELVRERTPWRCLERLEHVSIVSYLSSKMIWSIFISLIQVLIFSAILYGIPKIETEEVSLYWELNNVFKYEESPGFVFLPAISLILFIVCVMGSWMALAVSAIFKQENAAVGLLPIILIPVLFLSQPIMLDDNFNQYPPRLVEHIHRRVIDENSCRECARRKQVAAAKGEIQKTSNGQYNTWALSIKRWMPCHEPQVLMEQLHNKYSKSLEKTGDDSISGDDSLELANARARMIRNIVFWMLLSLCLMAFFQHKNEKKWEGR